MILHIISLLFLEKKCPKYFFFIFQLIIKYKSPFQVTPPCVETNLSVNLIIHGIIPTKGQGRISYYQRPPISLKILLNISSLISAQFCNEMCAYE